MKRKVIFSILVLFVVLVVVFWVFFPRQGKENNTKITHKKEIVKRGDIETAVFISGILKPVTIVDVSTQVSGKITKIYIDFNSKVRNGQILAELDQVPFLARIRQNEAIYESAKVNLRRAEINLRTTENRRDRLLKLFEKQLISFQEKETIEAQYETALIDVELTKINLSQIESQLEFSKADLNYTVIKSPIDGIVISKNVNEGQTVIASFQAPVLFQIANDLTEMQAEYHVKETNIRKIREGQIIKFSVEAFPEEKFYGKIIQIRYVPEIIQGNVSYPVIVRAENPDLKLRPGMTAISGKAINVLKVPNTALEFASSVINYLNLDILKRLGRDFSYVIIETERGEIELVVLKTELTDGNWTEIVQVVKGSLKEGQHVFVGVEWNRKVGLS